MRRGIVFCLVVLSVLSGVYAQSITTSTSFLTGEVEEHGFISIPLTIRNTDTVTHDLFFELHGPFSISTSILEVSPESEVVIDVHFNASMFDYGVYAGFLRIFSENDSFSVPIVVEHETVFPRFDATVQVTSDLTRAVTGPVDFVVTVFNINQEEEAVDITYNVFDEEGTVLFAETESVAFMERIVLKKSFNLGWSAGSDYILAITSSYNGSVGVESLLFTIPISPAPAPLEYVSFIFYGLGFILLLLFSYLVYRSFNYYAIRPSNFFERKIVRCEQHCDQITHPSCSPSLSTLDRLIARNEDRLTSIHAAYLHNKISRMDFLDYSRRLQRVIEQLNRKKKLCAC